MSYFGRCDCGCADSIRRLEGDLQDLRYELDSLRRELREEVGDRQDAIRSVRSDLSDLYAEVTVK